MAEKWFGPIAAGKIPRKLPQEPPQTAARFMETEAKVPLNALYKAYRVPGRFDKGIIPPTYYAMYWEEESQRVCTKLLKERSLFANINASQYLLRRLWLTGHSRQFKRGCHLETADTAVEEVLNELIETPLAELELSKVKNQAESTLVFSEVSAQSRHEFSLCCQYRQCRMGQSGSKKNKA
ncbi:MAG: hypothetical protein R2822_14030 [Spirosomataceae bacterium]